MPSRVDHRTPTLKVVVVVAVVFALTAAVSVGVVAAFEWLTRRDVATTLPLSLAFALTVTVVIEMLRARKKSTSAEDPS